MAMASPACDIIIERAILCNNGWGCINSIHVQTFGFSSRLSDKFGYCRTVGIGVSLQDSGTIIESKKLNSENKNDRGRTFKEKKREEE